MFARHGAVSIFALLILLSSPVTAEDAPYSPAEFSIDDLIVTEQFDSTPISFPWSQVSESRTTDGARMDFELIYDVDYDTALQTFTEAYMEGEDVITLEPHALKYASVEGLRPIGLQLGEIEGRITVGHPEIEPYFIVDLEADGNRTRFVVHNFTRARQFSGFVPSRVDFHPVGADPIPFRWN